MNYYLTRWSGISKEEWGIEMVLKNLPGSDAGALGVLGHIGRIASEIWRADKWIGICINIALLIVLCALVVHMSGAGEEGFAYLIGKSWIPLVVAICFLVIARAVRHAIYGHIIVCSMMCLTLLLIVQAVSGNRIPFVMPANCLFELKRPGCPLSGVSNAQISAAPTVALVSAEAAVSMPEPNFMPGAGPVFVQFAGALQRKEVADMALTLKARGWNIQGADKGGERTASAAGLNEVRYFHPADKPAAEALASALAASANWVTGEIAIKDLSAAGLAASKGQLEIWTSI
ncbi:hypothetical protein [Paracoccus litorisediminis]|uniref:Uncharacterized protein n=1 Tax=Paracoccus litorisediminis TaxID=2006130 RepID=A0A844HJK3_9RHOB|nr:hypothetical protein [Paracoccus litorisediminis]MTH60056.1 hypothetical protein [Paracoccus litorisediminis]